MKFAYADPPYYGCGASHYGRPEWDRVDTHRGLIDMLWAEYPDGWVLSCTTGNLYDLIPIVRDVVERRTGQRPRIGFWGKTFASFKPNVNPAYACEPVIFWGGRKRDRTEDTVRDWVSCPITLQRGLTGAKPETFCFWVFQLLGAQPGDEFVDLFPGSGAVTRAWEAFSHQHVLALGAGVPPERNQERP